MLTNIKVKNYKGFKEAEIPIKPITILLGANSSGKSSILQLLLLLQQTAEATDSYKSALKIYGKRISIGKPENLYYGFKCDNPIEIQIGFRNREVEYFLDNLKSRYFDELSRFGFDSKYKKYKDKENSVKIRDEIRAFFDDKSLKEQFKAERNVFRYGFGSFITDSNILYEDTQSLLRCYDFLDDLNKIRKSPLSVVYNILFHNNSLIVSGFTLLLGKVVVLSYKSNEGFSSDLADLAINEINYLKSEFNDESTIFDMFGKNSSGIDWIDFFQETKSTETSLTKAMLTIVKYVLSGLKDEFTEPIINHVSPLRAHPQRYYMLDKANISYSLDTYDANAIAEVIKENTTLKDRVNDWFKQFGLKVDVDGFKEAIHKLTVQQSGLPLDIPDVGFGVSQVLPVVLQGFLSPKNSVTIVEQPEVHLHPKMQAALSDLFIDITKESKFTKCLIIETHSEYLLKRLRRRMAEGDNITPDKVSINLFHTRTEETSATIENLSIEDKGAFEWPKEYYDEELYNDVVKFLELQGDGDIHINN